MADQGVLLKILCKITFKQPGVDIDLSERELEILSATRGDVIMSLAYKNQLNPTTLMANADEIITHHNMKKINNLHDTIRSLNQEIHIEAPKKRKSMKRNYDPDDVERRIMAEAIEEVAGLENNNIADPEIVVENAGVEQSGQPTYGIPRLSWFDYMDNSRLQGSHVSHQRNGNSMANPNITLPEVIPRIIPDVDNLPDATNEDLMELGIYAIPGLARPLFDKVNPPKVHSTPVSRLQHPPSVPTSANLAITTDVSAVNQAPLDPPVIQTPVDLEQPTTPIIQHQQEPQEQAANVQANDQIEPNQGHSQNGTTPARPQDARAKPSRGTLQIENTASNMTLQRQILETVRQELVPDTRTDQQKAKKRVARPRKQAVQPSRRVRTQPMHKELIFHTKKTTRPNQPHQQLTIHFQKNILEGLDNYVVFERDSEPVDVEAIIRELTIDDTVNPEMEEDQVQPVQQQQQVPEWEENLIEMQAAPQAPQTNDIPQRGSTSNFIPDGSINQEPVASSTLRPSLIQHVLRPSMHRNGTANSPNVLSQNVTPESVQVDRHVDNPDRPIAKDVPVATGAIPKSRVSQIPASDIEFARLSHMSRQRQMSNSGEQMQIPDEVSGQNRPKEAHFFEFNGQSEVLINLEGHDGRREIYSKYCMETISLLFQIRIVFRRNNCRSMKWAELAGQLSLLDPNATVKIFERRLDLLENFKLLKLKYSDDDRIEEVEL